MDTLLQIFSGRHGSFIAWSFGIAAAMVAVELFLLRWRVRRSAGARR